MNYSRVIRRSKPIIDHPLDVKPTLPKHSSLSAEDVNKLNTFINNNNKPVGYDNNNTEVKNNTLCSSYDTVLDSENNKNSDTKSNSNNNNLVSNSDKLGSINKYHENQTKEDLVSNVINDRFHVNNLKNAKRPANNIKHNNIQLVAKASVAFYKKCMGEGKFNNTHIVNNYIGGGAFGRAFNVENKFTKEKVDGNTYTKHKS